MYPVFSGTYDKDVFIAIFQRTPPRPVVTVLDKHACKTNQMILAAHYCIKGKGVP